MRTMLLIAAGLASLFAATSSARAQYFYGWGYYRPYYPVPYGYYPAPYYAPPPVFYAPYPRLGRRRVAARFAHHDAPRRVRGARRPLVNPLLGPLPGLRSSWTN